MERTFTVQGTKFVALVGAIAVTSTVGLVKIVKWLW